jgi:hypothetical protein
MSPKKIRAAACAFAGAALLALASSPGLATTVEPMSVVDLLNHAQTIVAGHVTKVTDGFDAKGIPYTEVSLDVSDSIRGPKSKTYTFRQFGLAAPRTMPDGRVHLGARPAGWPTWRAGESAIVFLYPKAKYTGLQTTVGLGYGKLSTGNGAALNAHDNATLFTNVTVNRALLDSAELQMVDTKHGPVNDATLRKFLHRAVDGNWIKNGSIGHAKR